VQEASCCVGGGWHGLPTRHVAAVASGDIRANKTCEQGVSPGDCTDGSDERLHYLTDANINVVALVDGDGVAVERYAYDPYGNVTVLDADFSADADGASDYDNPVLYCGYWRDAETQLYHVRYRYYHPRLGCWITRDPREYSDGMSLYQYLGSDPVGYTDAAGLDRYVVIRNVHAVLVVEEWDDCGNLIGYQEFSMAPNQPDVKHWYDWLGYAWVFATAPTVGSPGHVTSLPLDLAAFDPQDVTDRVSSTHGADMMLIRELQALVGQDIYYHELFWNCWWWSWWYANKFR